MTCIAYMDIVDAKSLCLFVLSVELHDVEEKGDNLLNYFFYYLLTC